MCGYVHMYVQVCVYEEVRVGYQVLFLIAPHLSILFKGHSYLNLHCISIYLFIYLFIYLVWVWVGGWVWG